MDAKEVIVAQAVANAELMAERDALRNQMFDLAQENQRLNERVAELTPRDEPPEDPDPAR